MGTDSIVGLPFAQGLSGQRENVIHLPDLNIGVY